jgi:hypothetical protein
VVGLGAGLDFSEQKEKPFSLTGLEPRTAHAVESHYNDYILPNRKKIIKSRNT